MRMSDYEWVRVICVSCPWTSKNWSTSDPDTVKYGAVAMENFDRHEALHHADDGATARIDGLRPNPIGVKAWASGRE